LTHEPYFLRQSCATPRNSVGWRRRLTSIQLGRPTFRRTVHLSAITTMLIGRLRDGNYGPPLIDRESATQSRHAPLRSDRMPDSAPAWSDSRPRALSYRPFSAL
jgi:hypothetical protein